jgi:integrase
MREACLHARIRPAVGFHCLRHTWAFLAVMAGMPLIVVGKNLGHADTKMVEAHYGHLAPSYMADAVRKHAAEIWHAAGQDHRCADTFDRFVLILLILVYMLNI